VGLPRQRAGRHRGVRVLRRQSPRVPRALARPIRSDRLRAGGVADWRSRCTRSARVPSAAGGPRRFSPQAWPVC
jgi:hypothetical protein